MSGGGPGGELEGDRVREYFSRRETVAEWWTPDEGPLAFHYDAEIHVLDEQLLDRPAFAGRELDVLDVGTGRGRFGIHAARRGARVVGVDLNPDMVELAGENARASGVADRFQVRQGSAEDLSVHGVGRFDVVLCMELFDHLPDLARVLGEMHRALRPGGRLAFTYVPDESLYGALGNLYRRAKRRSGEVMISRTYTLAEVERRLDDNDLVLEAHFGIGLLCASAQTRLFAGNPLVRLANALARAESRWRPYHAGRLARHGAHVVGIARRTEDPPERT
ncbi:MAG: class I SAM-dependent methyltransferase [Myxococcota bacterium]